MFETRLRVFNEARKGALRKPGAFAPLEAAMWSHPVILQLAARLQRATCYGDSPTAWKGTLFEGCYVGASERDAVGASLYTSAPVGGAALALQRRLVDISGPFAVPTNCSPPVPSVELTPAQPKCVAVHTSNGNVLRAFGEGETPHAVFRQSDPMQDLAWQAEPKDPNSDAARKLHASSGPEVSRQIFQQLILSTEAKARQRYGHWVMRTEVPQKARAVKEQTLAFFEELVTSTEASIVESSKQLSRSSAPGSTGAAGGAGGSSRGRSEGGPGPTPAGSLRTFALAKPRSPGAGAGQLPGGLAGPGSAAAGPCGGRRPPPLAQPGGSDGARGALRLRPFGGLTLPKTVEEVGQLVAESDALLSILSIDQGERGGFARRCAAGWKSGYREEPMSQDELRRARLLHRPVGPGPGGGGRSTGAPSATLGLISGGGAISTAGSRSALSAR